MKINLFKLVKIYFNHKAKVTRVSNFKSFLIVSDVFINLFKNLNTI